MRSGVATIGRPTAGQVERTPMPALRALMATSRRPPTLSSSALYRSQGRMAGVEAGPSGSGPGAASAFEEVLQEAAMEHGLEPELLKAVIKAESGFNPKAVSRAGAKGLMQLMDSTARGLGVQDPFDPVQNVHGGALYLRRLLDRYGDIRLALAAYNAGAGAVDRYGGIPPFRETQAYVPKVLKYLEEYRRAP